MIPLVYLFATQHCHSTFTKLVTPRQLTCNLTGTISYDSYSAHVVIYIPTVYLLIEDTTLSFLWSL